MSDSPLSPALKELIRIIARAAMRQRAPAPDSATHATQRLELTEADNAPSDMGASAPNRQPRRR